jgi:hypothetical protein
MSVWEFNSAVAGYVEAHTPADTGMSEAEQELVWAAVESKMGRMQ